MFTNLKNRATLCSSSLVQIHPRSSPMINLGWTILGVRFPVLDAHHIFIRNLTPKMPEYGQTIAACDVSARWSIFWISCSFAKDAHLFIIRHAPSLQSLGCPGKRNKQDKGRINSQSFATAERRQNLKQVLGRTGKKCQNLLLFEKKEEKKVHKPIYKWAIESRFSKRHNLYTA